MAQAGWRRLGLPSGDRAMVAIYERFERIGDGRKVTLDIGVEAFDARWTEGEPHQYVGPGGTGAALGDRYPDFIDHLKSHRVITPTEAGFNEGNLWVSGRHRFAVLRDLGFPRVPVTVPIEEVGLFERGGLLVRGAWSLPVLRSEDVFSPGATVVGSDLAPLGFSPEAARLVATFPWDRLEAATLYGSENAPMLVASVSLSRALTVQVRDGKPFLLLGSPGEAAPLPLQPGAAAYVLSRIDRLSIPIDASPNGPPARELLSVLRQALRGQASGSGLSAALYDIREGSPES